MSNTTARDASGKDVAEPKGKPVAPPDTAAETWTRRSILAAFWGVVILLGLPYWLWTTSVYRAELDVASASRWINGEGCDMRYRINVVVDDPDAVMPNKAGKFLDDLQALLNDGNSMGPFEYQISPTTSSTALSGQADLLVKISRSHQTEEDHGSQPRASELHVYCPTPNGHKGVRSCPELTAERIRAVMADEITALTFLARDSPYSQQLQHPMDDTTELERRSTRAFKYASSYHLTFSLFTASSTPSSWAIESALQQYIHPLLQALSPVSNFTIDTQVQYYSSFSPSMAGPHYNEQTQSLQLDQADLSGFINAAEWPLNPSIDAGPTINFVLYIPSADGPSLEVAGSRSNSWVIPQWGGVQILNSKTTDELSTEELESVMYTFADQLTALLGFPKQPASLQLRIKALTRQRVLSLFISASDTLGALIRLTEKLEQIAIPQTVAQAVSGCVADLELACHDVHAGDHKNALLRARKADEAVEKAFFEPSMVGQVYFPDEHKVAVYVPLLGPMAVPLIMATVKELRQWRQRKVKTS